MDDLYTEEVKKCIYQAKSRLPKDFPIITSDEEEFWLKICVEREHFAWRTVEDRLAIALELESLRQAIERTGIRCVIEKDWEE